MAWAVLGSRGIEFEYTHDLRRLIAEVTAAVGEFPFDNAQVIALTEHAVPLRYDEILDTEPIDRQATLALVNDVGDWAVAQLPPAASSSELNRRHLGASVREKLGPEIGPQLQLTQPNSLDVIGSIRPDSPPQIPSLSF